MEYSKVQVNQDDEATSCTIVIEDGEDEFVLFKLFDSDFICNPRQDLIFLEGGIAKKVPDPHISVLRKASDPRILAGPDHKDINDMGEDNDGTALNEQFVYSHHGLSTERAAQLLAQYGRNELPEKVVPKWYIFISQLWQVTKFSLTIQILLIYFECSRCL